MVPARPSIPAPIDGGKTGRVGNGTTSCFTSSTSALFPRRARSREPRRNWIILRPSASLRSRSCQSALSAADGTGAMTELSVMLQTRTTAGRTTSKLSSKQPTSVELRCSSMSFTATSDPRGISFRFMRPSSSPAVTGPRGAKRSDSTDRTPSPCATSSSRTRNIGSRNFIWTDCASTPSTRSRTTRGPICSMNLRGGFAPAASGLSICCWRTRTTSHAA